MNWLTKDEALKYLGLTDDTELENLVADYDLDVELDGGDNLILVEADGAKEMLFEEHKKKVGHRPDDINAMNKQKIKDEQKVKEEKDRAKAHKKKLKQKLGKPE